MAEISLKVAQTTELTKLARTQAFGPRRRTKRIRRRSQAMPGRSSRRARPACNQNALSEGDPICRRTPGARGVAFLRRPRVPDGIATLSRSQSGSGTGTGSSTGSGFPKAADARFAAGHARLQLLGTAVSPCGLESGSATLGTSRAWGDVVSTSRPPVPHNRGATLRLVSRDSARATPPHPRKQT